jgi:hypothetical protein
MGLPDTKRVARLKGRLAFSVGGSERLYLPAVCRFMLKRLKGEWRRFKRSPVGHRFRNRYGRAKVSQEVHGAGGRFLRLVLAALAFVVGVIFSILPVLPGFVFFFVSASLLATDSYRVAQFLDWSEVKLRELWSSIRRRKRGLAKLGHHH